MVLHTPRPWTWPAIERDRVIWALVDDRCVLRLSSDHSEWHARPASAPNSKAGTTARSWPPPPSSPRQATRGLARSRRRLEHGLRSPAGPANPVARTSRSRTGSWRRCYLVSAPRRLTEVRAYPRVQARLNRCLTTSTSAKMPQKSNPYRTSPMSAANTPYWGQLTRASTPEIRNAQRLFRLPSVRKPRRRSLFRPRGTFRSHR